MKALVAAAILASTLLLPPGSTHHQELDPGYWQSSILPQMGMATYYAPGMMQYVHDYRIGHGQLPPCPECVGSVALLRAGDIGRKVWLQPPGGELAGPFQVVDCAQVGDIPPLLDRNWVVDVDYAVGQTWGMAGPLNNVIVWPDPSEGNQPPRVVLPTQLYIDPRDAVVTVPTLPAPTVAPDALPTRLPVPRNNAPLASNTASSQRAPLTPIVTTPTPPGWTSPTQTPLPTSTAALARDSEALKASRAAEPRPGQGTPGIAVFVAVTPNAEVALGRAGGGLLTGGQPGWPARLVEPASPETTTESLSSATSVPPVEPVATRVAGDTGQPPRESLWQRFWHALSKLVGGH